MLYQYLQLQLFINPFTIFVICFRFSFDFKCCLKKAIVHAFIIQNIKCAARWQYLLVRTNYLIEKRNRIFLVSAMMWWWSSTLNVTMHQLQRGVPTPLHYSHELTNTIHATNRHRTNPETINNQILVTINLGAMNSTTDDDDLDLMTILEHALMMNEHIRTLVDEFGSWWIDVDGWIVMMMVMIWYGWPNRHRKHQRFKMMQMAIWYIIPTTFSITDVRDNFCENIKLQLFNFSMALAVQIVANVAVKILIVNNLKKGF